MIKILNYYKKNHINTSNNLWVPLYWCKKETTSVQNCLINVDFIEDQLASSITSLIGRQISSETDFGGGHKQGFKLGVPKQLSITRVEETFFFLNISVGTPET